MRAEDWVVVGPGVVARGDVDAACPQGVREQGVERNTDLAVCLIVHWFADLTDARQRCRFGNRNIMRSGLSQEPDALAVQGAVAHTEVRKSLIPWTKNWGPPHFSDDFRRRS